VLGPVEAVCRVGAEGERGGGGICENRDDADEVVESMDGDKAVSGRASCRVRSSFSSVTVRSNS
jgi:hypothetical protein